jgi:hypothetical protein
MHGCTAIMRNFLPHARVLARTFLEHNPDARMTVLVVDSAESVADEPFEVVGPWDLGLEVEEVHRVLTLFAGAVPAGALRGALMEHLLQADQEPILFFDPDVQVFASLRDAHRLAGRHGVVLSPHLMAPPAHHHGYGGDRALLLSGAFNSGFLAVGLAGASFLRWWSARLRRWTLLEPTEGYYGVQRWLDPVPAMFPHHVLDDPGVNVMTMNAHERSLGFRDGHWMARQGRLRTFHFGGMFDPRTPYLPAARLALTEALFSEHAWLAELHRGYSDALLVSGWHDHPPLAPPIHLQPGVPLDATMRAAYREALLKSERTGGAEPPNPFTHGPVEFLDWLTAPTDLRRNACLVSRYLQTRWRDDSVARSFPNLVDADAERLVAWARSAEGAAEGVPMSLTRTSSTPVSAVTVAARGVNVVTSDGVLSDFLGQRILGELRATGERVALVTYPGAPERRIEVSSGAARAAVNDVTVICLRPGSLPDFHFDIGVLFRPGRHVIVALVDSVCSLDDLAAAMPMADEVWCWDERTARRVREACDAHTEVLAFPATSEFLAGTGTEFVCWADLADPGHSDALLNRVRRYLDANDESTKTLRVHVSSWDSDPATAETLWGLAQSHHHCLTVRRSEGWQQALAGAQAVLSLGDGIGPVEAQALAAGIDVLPHPPDQPAGMFGAMAARRIGVLHERLMAGNGHGSTLEGGHTRDHQLGNDRGLRWLRRSKRRQRR